MDSFNELIRPCVQKTHEYVKKMLSKANLSASDVDRVLLVGEGTRAKLVRSMLEELIGQSPCMDIDPDLCVAMGAAAVAHEMSQRDSAPESAQQYGKMLPPAPFQTQEISSYPVSIVVMSQDRSHEVNSEMIQAGSPIPTSITDRFGPVGDNVAGVRIKVTQEKEQSKFKDEQCIANFDLPITPLPESKGKGRIEVTYFLDESGIVVVTAKDHISGNTIEGKTDTKVALSQKRIDQEKRSIRRKTA